MFIIFLFSRSQLYNVEEFVWFKITMSSTSCSQYDHYSEIYFFASYLCVFEKMCIMWAVRREVLWNIMMLYVFFIHKNASITLAKICMLITLSIMDKDDAMKIGTFKGKHEIVCELYYTNLHVQTYLSSLNKSRILQIWKQSIVSLLKVVEEHMTTTYATIQVARSLTNMSFSNMWEQFIQTCGNNSFLNRLYQA